MSCTGCGSNNTYTGNCGCSDPIELICTGPTGPTGPAGSNGADGSCVLYNLENAVIYATAPKMSETLLTIPIDNSTPITVGSYFEMVGFLRYNNDGAGMSFMYTAEIKCTDSLGNSLNIGGFSKTVSSGVSWNLFFDIQLHRATPVAPATKSEFLIRQVSNWHENLGDANLFPTVDLKQIPVASATLDFTKDFTIAVAVSKFNLGGGGVAFIPNEGGISSMVINKYLK